MLFRYVSVALSQNGQTKHWFWRGPFGFFVATVAEGKMRGVQLVVTTPLNDAKFYNILDR